MGEHVDRNAQFENIARIKGEYLGSANPIVSIDTKKKELLGTFYRDGKVYCRQPLLAYDHDFPSYAEGKVIPYGVYDLKRNFGYLSVVLLCDLIFGGRPPGRGRRGGYRPVLLCQW